MRGAHRRVVVRGFTLLELLVAMAIFAILGTLALSGYTQLQRQSEYAEQRLERLREVQRAVQLIGQDLAEIEPRPIREPLGDVHMPAVLGGESVEYSLEFTRSGWSNTAGLPRPTLQRVGYRLEGSDLWRDHWATLDRTLSVEPIRQKLLGSVNSVQFRYLAPDRTWVDRWPIGEAGGAGAGVDSERLRPAAVEVVIDLQDWGEIRRVIEVAG